MVNEVEGEKYAIGYHYISVYGKILKIIDYEGQ